MIQDMKRDIVFEDQQEEGDKQRPCNINLVAIMMHHMVESSGYPVRLRLEWG